MTTAELCELDAEVGRLLGWTDHQHPLGTHCGFRSTAKTGWGDATTWLCWHDPDDSTEKHLPAFTTDPAALETLKRWLRENDYRYEIDVLPDEASATIFRRAKGTPGWVGINHYEQWCPTEGLALVRAVLAAFGGAE